MDKTKKIPAVVIGVGGFGVQTARALHESKRIDLVGVSDNDPRTAEKCAREFDVPGYSDNRSLLAEVRPVVAFLAVPPTASPELIQTCSKRGVHVWKELPLARDLGEAVAMVDKMESAGLKLAVGTQRRFASGYRHAWELRRRVGQVFLGRAHYLFNWGPKLAWRGDRESAGGGALLELGYHAVDLMVWMLGLPDEVYGLTAGRGAGLREIKGKVQPVYDTDDTGAAILRYSSGAMATIVTTRCSGPISEELSLHGRDGSLMADMESCLLRDPDGTVLDCLKDNSPPADVFLRQAEAFVQAVAGDTKTYECSGRENLLNQAVLEALYLSDRTCQPETPLRLLHTHGLTPDECLSRRPVEPETNETQVCDELGDEPPIESG